MSAKNIFICYRRDDSEGYAGRLYDRLVSRFPGHVFMDVTGISPGADFLRVIQDRVGSCHILIAIIGRQWATVTDASNRRRLDLPDDYVRHEIATALSRNITVIPVLVRGAEMPARELLPPDLAGLSTRHALQLTDDAFDYQVHRLIEILEVGGEPRPVPRPPIPRRRSGCLVFAILGIIAIVVIVVVLFVLGVLSNIIRI
jgi:TIR domain